MDAAIKVHFETYGCQMNVSDTERARQLVNDAGLHLVETPEEADVVMLNTCSIRAKAERKVLARVDELHHLTRHQKTPPVIGVMGCVAQLNGADLLEANARVGLVIGTQAVGRLPATLREAFATQQKTLDLGLAETPVDLAAAPVIAPDEAASYVAPAHLAPLPQLAVRHSQTTAFVPIIEGCNKFCSYCIVPYARGRERSRTAAEILREVRELKAVGVAEVHLIGQNVNSYRPLNDALLASYTGATPFAKLLRAVAQTGLPRIKFTTSFPRDFHDDIVAALEEYPNLCNWVHLPVQSGSDQVLRAMRRGYTVAEYLRKIDRLKKSPKEIAITTDLIVGYPGETEADFVATLDLFQQCQFDGAYLFKYSPRPGTPSFALGDTVPESVKSERFARLQALQKEVQAAQQAKCVERILQVLVEQPSSRRPSEWHGHSTCHRLVNFAVPSQNASSTVQTVKVGDIVPVLIDAVRTNSLHGLLAHSANPL